MVSVNLIFHVVSALTFAILIWYLLHLQAQLSFLRTLNDSLSLSQAKVILDWPQNFFRRFAGAQGIVFEEKGKHVGTPQKMDLKLWAEAHAALGIRSIDWDENRVRLSVRRTADLDSWGPRLEASLQGKIKVEWMEYRHP